jgi:hypothetical protein
MAEKTPAKAAEQAAPASELELALDLYRKREQSDLLEGVLLRDRIIDQKINIVVSSTESFSVRQDDILDQEDAPAGRPRRFWVKKGAEVWHCQKIKLDIQGEKPVKVADFPGFIDNHLSTQYSEFFARRPTSEPPVARALTKNEKCFLEYYHYYDIKPAQLDQPLKSVFHATGDDVRLRPLYYEWAHTCLIPRPTNRGKYIDECNTNRISTLRQFISHFGKSSHD